MAASSSLLAVEEKRNPSENKRKILTAISFDKKNWSDDKTPHIIRSLKINPDSKEPLILLSLAEVELEPLESKRSAAPVEYSHGIFKTLEEYRQIIFSLKENSSVESSIDPYSINDTDKRMPAGSHLLPNFGRDSVTLSPIRNKDLTKIRTVYAQMHRTALRSSTEDFDLHLVITENGLIDNLVDFFNNPLLRPPNLHELHIYKHNGQTLEHCHTFRRDNAVKSCIDYNYQHTIKMNHPEYKIIKRELVLTNMQSNVEAILKDQNTISPKFRPYIENFLNEVGYAAKEEKASLMAQLRAIPDTADSIPAPPHAKETLCSDIADLLRKESKGFNDKLLSYTLNDIIFLRENNIPVKFQLEADYSYHMLAWVKGKMSAEEIMRIFFLPKPNTNYLPFLNAFAYFKPNLFEELLTAIASKSINVPDRLAELLVVQGTTCSSFQQFIFEAPQLLPLILEQIKLSTIGAPKLAEALRLNDKEGKPGLYDILRYVPKLLPDVLAILGESSRSIDCIAQAFVYKSPTGGALHDVVKYAPDHLSLLMSKIALHPEGAHFILQALVTEDANHQSGKDAVKGYKGIIANAFAMSLTHVSPHQLQMLCNDLSAATLRPTATYAPICKRANSFFSQPSAKTTLWKQLNNALSQEIERRKSAPARSLTFVNMG